MGPLSNWATILLALTLLVCSRALRLFITKLWLFHSPPEVKEGVFHNINYARPEMQSLLIDLLSDQKFYFKDDYAILDLAHESCHALFMAFFGSRPDLHSLIFPLELVVRNPTLSELVFHNRDHYNHGRVRVVPSAELLPEHETFLQQRLLAHPEWCDFDGDSDFPWCDVSEGLREGGQMQSTLRDILVLLLVIEPLEHFHNELFKDLVRILDDPEDWSVAYRKIKEELECTIAGMEPNFKVFWRTIFLHGILRFGLPVDVAQDPASIHWFRPFS